jgi:formylglycine-generating enzyme required for sulfatase activity
VGDPRRGVGLRADGLPDIGWVFIPDKEPETGQREFIYGDNSEGNLEKRTEPGFWIARYPITYRQFQAFLDAPDGFRNDEWWRGLAAHPKHRREAGEQWFKYRNHPRENVSWYDAIAFCRWLTEKAKEHPNLLPAEPDRSRAWDITLPTEWQWEKAARGHDGRHYPWGGKDYKSGYANIDETPIGADSHYLQKTSAVGMYSQGNSPYGVADLSGNVWEWCLNEYNNPERVQLEGDEWRVLRGGSWSYVDRYAAAPFRHRDLPYARLYRYGIGFRVCAVIQQE